MNFWKDYRVFLNSQLERVSVGEFMNLSKEERGDIGFVLKTSYNLMREVTFFSSSDPSVLYVLLLHPEVNTFEAYEKCLNLMKTVNSVYLGQLESLRRGDLLHYFLKNVRKKNDGALQQNLEHEKTTVSLGEIIPDNYVPPKTSCNNEESGEEEEGEGKDVEIQMFSPFLKSPGMSPLLYDQFHEMEMIKRVTKLIDQNTEAAGTETRTEKTKKKIKKKKNEKQNLRKVRVSSRLIREFLVISQPHIEKKVEFAGWLLGKAVPIGNDWYFQVTVLLIPDQEGNENSVETFSFAEIVDFKEQNNLVVLGWIHTHPTQAAYLSGRDIYTHYSQFQSNFDEAIAIVCSPRKKRNFGVFRIKTEKIDDAKKMVETRRFGKSLMNFSLFGGSLYEECFSEGKHCVVEEEGEETKKVVVVDIRKEKEVKILKK